MDFRHATVMREEVATLLAPSAGKRFADMTLGGGGHAEALLEKGASVIGFDRDPVALAAARERLAPFGERFVAIESPFADAPARLAAEGLAPLDGLIADLGVSSPQLDEAARGFSFSKLGPLDMRMGTTGETCAQLIARLDEAALTELLFTLGEESHARRIARAIKSANPAPTTTVQLADLVAHAIPRKAWPTRIHPATKTFQALRIAVNEELTQLDALLTAIPALLKPGGRAAIISFHSLEDRRVKLSFRQSIGRCRCPPGMPICVCGTPADFRLVTPKAVVATEAEGERNPRARSAHLRVLEKRS